MVAPFRLHILVLSVLAIGVSLVVRERRLAAVSAVVTLLAVAPVMLRVIERQSLPAGAEGGQAVSIVAMNVLFFNDDYSRASGLALAQDSDVLAAFETTPEWLGKLSALDQRYPYRYSPSGLKTSGISVHSKTPFKAELYKIGSRKAPLIKAEFEDYVLLAAHPYPPATPRLTQDIGLYFETLDQLARQQSKPVIIAGDLNATLWSPSLASLMRSHWQWPHGSGFMYTWPTFAPVLAIQIDHVLTKGVRAGKLRVLTAVGSDHLPVRADLIL